MSSTFATSRRRKSTSKDSEPSASVSRAERWICNLSACIVWVSVVCEMWCVSEWLLYVSVCYAVCEWVSIVCVWVRVVCTCVCYMVCECFGMPAVKWTCKCVVGLEETGERDFGVCKKTEHIFPAVLFYWIASLCSECCCCQGWGKKLLTRIHCWDQNYWRAQHCHQDDWPARVVGIKSMDLCSSSFTVIDWGTGLPDMCTVVVRGRKTCLIHYLALYMIIRRLYVCIYIYTIHMEDHVKIV